jgi:hypothetical protein
MRRLLNGFKKLIQAELILYIVLASLGAVAYLIQSFF